MAETAMSLALERAGLDPADAALNVALAQYFNRGGTVERARALLDRAAAQLRGAGHRASADSGHHSSARAPQVDPGGGKAEGSAPQGHHLSAAPSPGTDPALAGAGGHYGVAGDGQVMNAPSDNAASAAGDAAVRAMPKGQVTIAASPHHPASAGAAGHGSIAGNGRGNDARGNDPAPASTPHALSGPSPAQRRAALGVERRVAKIVLMNTYVHEANSQIGDVAWVMAETLADRNGDREFVWRQILALWRPGAATVREAITEEQLQAIARMVPRLPFAKLIEG